MQTVLAYSDTTGGSVVDHDMLAVIDAVFPTKNSHFVFTNRYYLRAAAYFGVSGTRVNFQPPSWEAVTRMNLWPLNLAATVPSPPQLMWFDSMLPELPQNEEFLVKNTSTLSEVDNVLLWLQTPMHNRNIPAGTPIVPLRFTSAVTIVANGWSGLATMTLEKSLRGGIYAVCGFQGQCTNGLAMRFVAPRVRSYNGQPIRPGYLLQNTLGHLEETKSYMDPYLWGETFRFHSYEPPSIEVYGVTAGAQTLEGRLYAIYIPGSEAELSAWAAQGWQ